MTQVLNPSDFSRFDATMAKLTKTIEVSGKKAAISRNKEGGFDIDPVQVGADAAAKFDDKIAATQTKIDSATQMVDGLEAAYIKAKALSSKIQSLAQPVTVASSATLDTGLQDVLTAVAVGGADAATHNVEVKQLADKQRWVFKGVDQANNAFKPFTATSLTTKVVTNVQDEDSALFYVDPAPGVWLGQSGRFEIRYGSPVVAANVDLVNGDNLQDVVNKINTAATGANIPITAKIHEYDKTNHYYEIVIESNGTGSRNSFQIVPVGKDVFRAVSSAPIIENTSSVCIFKDSNMDGWSPGAANFTGILPNTYIKLNGTAIAIGDPGTDTNNALADIVDSINNDSHITGVYATVETYTSGNFNGHKYIKLIRNDGTANIDIDISGAGLASSFGCPSQLGYTGVAPSAIVKVDRIASTYQSNTITSPTPDLSSVTLKKTGSGTINIGQGSVWESNIRAWVDAVNDASQFIAAHTQVDNNGKPVSKLFGSSVLNDLTNLITKIGSARSPDPTATNITSLKDIGITFQTFTKDGVDSQCLRIDENMFKSVMSDPKMISQVQALFSPYFAATATDINGGATGLIVGQRPANVDARTLDAKVEILATNTYAGNFNKIELICGDNQNNANDYTVRIYDINGAQIFSDLAHGGNLVVAMNAGDFDLTEPVSGLALKFLVNGGLLPDENPTVDNIQYIPPNVVHQLNDGAKLVLDYAAGGFDLTGFDVKISNFAVGVMATAVYKGVTYNFDTESLGAKTLLLKGQAGTPFAGLNLRYSADTALAIGQYNIFSNVTFKHGDFDVQANILANYIDSNKGSINSAIKSARDELSRVQNKLGTLQKQQTSAADKAEKMILARQLEEDILDQAMDSIMKMLFGDN